jgi:hypothetical protein
MDALKVFIENLPLLADWAAIGIALCALIVSIVSLYWSQIQYRNSIRPFVWLIDFAYLNEQQLLINQPEVVATRVINAPALIKQMKYEFYVLSGEEKNIFHSHQQSDFVRFPDPSSQATYTVRELTGKVQQCRPGDKIERYLRVDYSALSGGKEYFFESASKYDFSEQRWRVIYEKAS